MQPRSLHRSTASLHVGLRDLDRKKQRYNDQSVTRCRKSQFAHGQFARKVENLLESHKLQLPAETKKHMYALLLQKVVLLLDLGPEDIRTFPLGFVVILGRQLDALPLQRKSLDGTEQLMPIGITRLR